MQIDIYNPNGTVLRDIECEWSLSRKRLVDRIDPASLDLTVIRRHFPIRQYAKVVAKDDENVMFLGYAESDNIQNGSEEVEWTCYGVEKLLAGRWAPRYYWPANTTFSDILSDQPVGDKDPGLFVMANGAIPPGTTHTIYSDKANIIKLDGRGSLSHFGECDFYSCSLYGLRKLNEIADLNMLSAVDYYFYRDADDVYIRISNAYDRGWNINGGLIAHNAYDTLCRLGTISDPGMVLGRDVETDSSEIGATIVSLATALGFYTHVRYTEKYAYFDFDESIGRA